MQVGVVSDSGTEAQVRPTSIYGNEPLLNILYISLYPSINRYFGHITQPPFLYWGHTSLNETEAFVLTSFFISDDQNTYK